MEQRVTSKDVMEKLGEVKEVLLKKLPIDSHPFLSLAAAFGAGILLFRSSSGSKEKDESALSPYFEKLIALFAPVILEKITEELE